MEFLYTRHAEEKLLREDIRNFGIGKSLIEKAILNPNYLGKTKTGELSAIIAFNTKYILRVVYVKIEAKVRIITFYIAKKGRYGT